MANNRFYAFFSIFVGTTIVSITVSPGFGILSMLTLLFLMGMAIWEAAKEE